MKTFFFLLTLSRCILGQDLKFFREDITFNLDSANFNVEGHYWFLNSSSENIERIIFYPFPRTEKDEFIDSVDVLDIYRSLHQNIINKSEKGFYFHVHLNPGDTGLYRIIYRQRVLSDSVKYILRSTKSWGKPLESAEFKLIISDRINVTRFSYQPDKTYQIDNRMIYYWKRTSFMPNLDMVFHFLRKRERSN